MSRSFSTHESDIKRVSFDEAAVLFWEIPRRRDCLAFKLTILVSGNSLEDKNDILKKLRKNKNFWLYWNQLTEIQLSCVKVENWDCLFFFLDIRVDAFAEFGTVVT